MLEELRHKLAELPRGVSVARPTPNIVILNELKDLAVRQPRRSSSSLSGKACSRAATVALLPVALALASCSGSHRLPNAVTVVIESSPNSLDPRMGVDAQSERIDALLFDSLLRKDDRFNLQPWLAASWERPDLLTYIFHLRSGVRFHNGQPLTSADVAFTLDSLRDGSLASPLSGNYISIASVSAPDPLTVVVHLKRPDNSLLWNLADGNFGVVPRGSSPDLGQLPIGSGPFKFESQATDKEVVLRRNDDYWQSPPSIARVRFSVVPDAITRALELQKGSADAEMNALTADMVYSLRRDPNLAIDTAPGTVLNYINFNVRDPLLRDVRVRRAIAAAIDRRAIIHALFRDQARPANSLLPIGHWAALPDSAPPQYDPAQARALLDAAGLKPAADGVRFRLTMKTSTDETTRLLAAILQQQLRAVGIALDLRSYEFGTFYGDIARGAFQMYALRWVGSNQDPDIFRYAYASASTPPRGANRGYYLNPQIDSLLADAAATPDNAQRVVDYQQTQRILAAEVPTINLWYLDNVLVHTKRLQNIRLDPSGSYDFLRYATLVR